MSPWTISAMNLEDLDAVLTIERICFAEPWSRRAFEEELKAAGAFLFVLKTASGPAAHPVIAYAAFRVIFDEIHIMRVAVQPDWRRRGAAAWLIKRAIEALEPLSIRRLTLEVGAGNMPAFQLYTHLGFQTIGKRRHYCGKTGEDSLIMERNIKEES